MTRPIAAGVVLFLCCHIAFIEAVPILVNSNTTVTPMVNTTNCKETVLSVPILAKDRKRVKKILNRLRDDWKLNLPIQLVTVSNASTPPFNATEVPMKDYLTIIYSIIPICAFLLLFIIWYAISIYNCCCVVKRNFLQVV